MAAILDDMRRLEAARRNGTLSESAFLDARSELLARIEDVELEQAKPDPVVHLRTPDASRFASGDVFNIAVFMVVGSIVLTALAAWLLKDLTLALTLTATVLAAVTVRAVQKLDNGPDGD